MFEHNYHNLMMLFCFLLDATLTLSNLSSALEAVDDVDWYALSYQLGIPESRLDELKRQSSVSVSSKQMMLREWMTSHPAPSWDIMTEVLYQEGYYHPRWHSILMEVKKLYGKGESSHTGNPLVSKCSISRSGGHESHEIRTPTHTCAL